MYKSWLLCVLLGSLSWGQAPPAAAPGAQQSGAPSEHGAMMMQQPAGASASTAEIPETAAVITIEGVCAPAMRAASSKPATGKTAASAARKADCKTVITRADFERIAKALQQGPAPLSPQQRRQLASMLPRFMAMSQAAKEKDLDKTAHFDEVVKLTKMQILSQELQHYVQEEADKISPAEIEAQYKDHPENYQQFSLDRIFIPRYKQQTPESKEEKQADEKQTEEQQKSKEAADKAKQEQGEQELDRLAESLRTRAANGEDFTKLQKEAYDAAGMKMDSPNVNLKVRRSSLPASQSAVFDLKEGDVSQVISDNGGHYIFKVISETALPLDQVKDEIDNTLRTERFRSMMDKYQNSYHVETNEAYFGPAPSPGMRPGMPMPQRQSQPPASKPN
jgi:hypothetical protein